MKISLILGILFLYFGCAFGQADYNADLVSPLLRNRANATIRTQETTVDMQSPENVMLKVKQAITVWNKNGEDNARLVIFYDKNTSIRSIKGEVYNEVGKLTSKFTQNEFIDESAANDFSLFEDSRVKHYLPAVSSYPYTIVYNYEIRYKQNLIIPDWIPKPETDLSVEKSSYTFICKPTDVLRIKTLNFNGKSEELPAEKLKTLTWKVENLLATKPEPYSPDPESYRCQVKIAAQQFSYFNHRGSYTNWQELGKWIYDDLLKSRGTLSPATIATILELVKNETSDEAKARKIYQYMQDKTRYISVQIGIGGFQPVAASEVDRLGYGDCKALVNYMQSLLLVAGIESYYCVVEAGNQKKSVDPSYASMVQGNHIILCMPLKGDTTWLECTSQKIPFGFLSDFTDDRLVLACTAEGGKLLRTPKLSTENNLQVRTASLQISSEGDVSGRIKTIFSGAQYDNHEEGVSKPIFEQKKLLREWYDIDNIEFSTILYSQKKDIAPHLNEELQVRFNNYAVVNNDKLFLQLNPFNVKNTVTEVRNRQMPLYLNRGYTDEDSIEYTLPEIVSTLMISDLDKKIETPFGSYISTTKLDGKKLNYYRKLVMKEGTFPAEKYADFSKFITEVSTADRLKLVLSLKK